MNREILFRGKRCSDGKWVYGFYVESKYSWQGHKPHRSWIVPNAISNGGFFNILGRYAVKDDTVGQFTGMTDKNGVKIFEGDVVCKHDLTFNLQHEGVVVYNSAIGCFRIHTESKGMTMRMGFEASDVFNDGKCTIPIKYDYEVIGNIYDNLELLSTKQA